MKRVLLGLAVLALAGCEVGPDYKLPDEAKTNAPAAQGGFISADAKTTVSAPVPDGWWRLYDDAVLNRLEEEALKANDDLRIAAANLQRARALQREVEGAQDPHFSAFFGAQRGQLSGESYLLPVPLPAQYLADAGIQASYQLDLFGRLARAAEAASADTEATEAGLDLARITVAAEVARAYSDGCAATHELSTAKQQVELQLKARSIAGQLSSAGRESVIEVTRTDIQVDQIRATLPVFEAHRRAAWFRLAVLTGHPPAEYPRDAEACTAPPRLHRPIPVGDGAGLLKRRPDIRAAERTLAAATAKIGVATAALYPEITLGASVGSTGLLTDIAQPAANHWGLGPLISWSVPGESEHARVAAADAQAHAALAHFDAVVLSALRETETSLTAYAHDLDRNDILRSARDHASLAVDQEDQLYKAGRSPFLNGINARAMLAATETALAASDDQIAADQVAIFLALGGGWPQK